MNADASQHAQPLIVIVMGVSGCGKSTIAELIAQKINAFYKDGDELHPQSNIDKMASGTPLTDADRQPWLEAVADYAGEKAAEHGTCVIACSALKQAYRKTLSSAGRVVYVFLEGSYELIASRMNQRSGHFMPKKLLDSQFEALEDPRQEPSVITVNIEPDPETIAANAVQMLEQQQYL